MTCEIKRVLKKSGLIEVLEIADRDGYRNSVFNRSRG